MACSVSFAANCWMKNQAAPILNAALNTCSMICEIEVGICDHFKANYNRYLDTFFDLYKKDEEFARLFREGKGFCLPHFADLVETAEKKLNDKQKAEFYPTLFKIMKENYQRLQEEVTWFTDKFDYRNKDKDWGNSKDSIQRCMQKLGGGYPADEPFTEGL